MNSTTRKTVKSELRALRRLESQIKSRMEREKRLKERLEFLKGVPSAKAEIIRIKKLLKDNDAVEYIRQSTELEEKYMRAVRLLDPLDQVIIMDGFINGRPYWMIGKEIGLSTRGVENRVSKLIDDIAALVYPRS